MVIMVHYYPYSQDLPPHEMFTSTDSYALDDEISESN